MENYEEYMSKIKSFYTYIGNLIELEEYNEIEELELLVKYIDDYNIDIDEIEQNDSENDDTETHTNPMFNFSDNENSESSVGSFDDILKSNSYGIYQNKPPSYNNSEKLDKLQTFINSKINTENILVYSKLNNSNTRCTNYLNNLYNY